MVDGRQVVSLTLPGSESHNLRLTVNAASHDSFWRRLSVLISLLFVGGSLFWAIRRFPIDHRWLIWLGVPLGLAWWLWLRPAEVGLAIAVVGALLGSWFAVRVRAERGRALESPLNPTAHEGMSG